MDELQQTSNILGICLAIVAILIVVLIVVVALTTKKANLETKIVTTSNGGTNKITPVIEKHRAMPEIVTSQQRMARLIQNTIGMRQAQRRWGNVPNGILATNVVNTLALVNRLNDMANPQLPVVIDIAIEANNPDLERELQRVLIESANQTRARLIQSRREAVAKQPTPGAKVDAYLKLATSHTSDDQNSHDTYVNKCLRNIMTILREDQKDITIYPISHIRKFIKHKYEITEENSETSVLTVIDLIDNKGSSKFNSSIEATESEVLQRVFQRIHDPKNVEMKEQMMDMLYKALASCWEGNSIVCINGRDAKILSVLVQLDHDTKLHELQTLEQHKNKLFIKTRELVKERSQIALKSNDEKVQLVAKAYLVENPEELPKNLDATAEKNFQLYLRKEISKMIEEECKGLPNQITEHIINEAVAAV